MIRAVPALLFVLAGCFSSGCMERVPPSTVYADIVATGAQADGVTVTIVPGEAYDPKIRIEITDLDSIRRLFRVLYAGDGPAALIASGYREIILTDRRNGNVLAVVLVNESDGVCLKNSATHQLTKCPGIHQWVVDIVEAKSQVP
jgi:hypothetical protein